jgi:hypothetical protein
MVTSQALCAGGLAQVAMAPGFTAQYEQCQSEVDWRQDIRLCLLAFYPVAEQFVY